MKSLKQKLNILLENILMIRLIRIIQALFETKIG